MCLAHWAALQGTGRRRSRSPRPPVQKTEEPSVRGSPEPEGADRKFSKCSRAAARIDRCHRLTGSSLRKETSGVSFRVSIHFLSHAASRSWMESRTSGMASLDTFCLEVRGEVRSPKQKEETI